MTWGRPLRDECGTENGPARPKLPKSVPDLHVFPVELTGQHPNSVMLLDQLRELVQEED